MTEAKTVAQDFEQTARLLLNADEASGLSAGCPLPDVESLSQLADDLRALLFPRLWLSSDSGSLPDAVQHVCARTRMQLCEQIRSALQHVQSSGLRVHRESECTVDESAAELTTRFFDALPQLQVLLQADIRAAFDRDPAARTHDEIIACYPGVQAILVYRLAHALKDIGVPYLPRMLSEWAHRDTGIDIHPGARIGPSFFIDHGTGVVVGETCVIGTAVTLYQGVTLGALSIPRDKVERYRNKKRHPTIEDDVIIYSNATILGPEAVIGARSVIGGNVWITGPVPPDTKVILKKPELIYIGKNHRKKLEENK